MKLKIFLSIILAQLIYINLFGQTEFLTSLKSNQALKDNRLLNNKQARMMALSLPFIDDFSYVGPNPSSLFWTDNSVYVNNTFSEKQPSLGVATFDGLNYQGVPYSSASYTYGNADTLTSAAIDLSTYTIGDSLYLSFFIEAQGLGQSPELEDSIYIEMKDMSGVWNLEWVLKTDSATAFTRVMLPILNVNYLYNDFQFRFRNKATLSGNNDHWNLDYVYLNAGRTAADTILNDMAISIPPHSFLKNYQTMPYKQFVASGTDEIDVHTMYAHNNAINNDNCQFACEIKNMSTGMIEFTNPGVANLVAPSSDFSFEFAIPAISTPAVDSVSIRSKYYLDPGAANSRVENDTIYTWTRMADQYAKDDGSAELAYGIYGVGSKIASKFHIYTPDTLQYIGIHWEEFNLDLSSKLINICVWQSIDTANIGAADDTIAVFTLLKPAYKDERNGFYYYPVREYLGVGDFYIGWQQVDPDIMNIGFDRNTNSSSTLYYNTGGAWNTSSFAGSVMMRPVMGVYRGDINVVIDESKSEDLWDIFPNPTQNYFQIQNIENKNVERVEIYNTQGDLISTLYSSYEKINTTTWARGIYFVKIFEKNSKNFFTKKIIKI